MWEGVFLHSIICYNLYFKCEFSHLKRYYRNEHTATCDVCHDAAGKMEMEFSMKEGHEQQDTSIFDILWCFQGHT